MENFEKRRDRFEFFDSFESPLLNLTFRLEVEDFLSYCKMKGYPPFHFFLYQLFQVLKNSDNFLYRIYNEEIIKIKDVIPSYTILGKDNLFNYTRFNVCDDMEEFIRRSQAAKEEASGSTRLINAGVDLDLRSLKNYVFVTSLPWLDFTSIQHPVFKFKSADIPAFAWGKFTQENGIISMPFSVQAHHGFVDAFHIHQLAEDLKKQISESIRK